MFLSSLLFPVVPVLPCSSPFSLLLPPSSSQRYGPGRPDWENHKDKLVNGWDEAARSAFKKLSAEEGAARGAKWTDVSARAARAATDGGGQDDEGAAKAEGKMGGKMGGGVGRWMGPFKRLERQGRGRRWRGRSGSGSGRRRRGARTRRTARRKRRRRKRTETSTKHTNTIRVSCINTCTCACVRVRVSVCVCVCVCVYVF